MKELNTELRQMLAEVEDLDLKISESRRGLKEQVATILSMPPPRVLYQGQKAGLGAQRVGVRPVAAPCRPHGGEVGVTRGGSVETRGRGEGRKRGEGLPQLCE